MWKWAALKLQQQQRHHHRQRRMHRSATTLRILAVAETLRRRRGKLEGVGRLSFTAASSVRCISWAAPTVRCIAIFSVNSHFSQCLRFIMRKVSNFDVRGNLMMVNFHAHSSQTRTAFVVVFVKIACVREPIKCTQSSYTKLGLDASMVIFVKLYVLECQNCESQVHKALKHMGRFRSDANLQTGIRTSAGS